MPEPVDCLMTGASAALGRVLRTSATLDMIWVNALLASKLRMMCASMVLTFWVLLEVR